MDGASGEVEPSDTGSVMFALNSSSGWRLDAVVRVVRLLSDLRSGRAGPNPRLHQPATTEQRVGLQRTGKRNAGVSRSPLPGFVYNF